MVTGVRLPVFILGRCFLLEQYLLACINKIIRRKAEVSLTGPRTVAYLAGASTLLNGQFTTITDEICGERASEASIRVDSAKSGICYLRARHYQG